MIRLDLDMPMPKSCARCPLCHDYMWCSAKEIRFGKEDDEWICDTRPNWCPLQEVQDPERGAGENRCVCCGEVIPEGRQVCPQCEK